MTSQVSDIVTLDVGPLIQLLTRSDLDLLLGDPDKVATWWRQQLRRPLEERPTGLTAGLDTPRGRAELLLRPELLLQAVRVNVPGKMAWWRDIDRAEENRWMKEYRPMPTYQKIREKLELQINTNLHEWLRVKLPELDAASVDVTAGLWRRRLQQLQRPERRRTRAALNVGRRRGSRSGRHRCQRHLHTEETHAARQGRDVHHHLPRTQRADSGDSARRVRPHSGDSGSGSDTLIEQHGAEPTKEDEETVIQPTEVRAPTDSKC